MNDPAASGGVSQEIVMMDAASGGESNLSGLSKAHYQSRCLIYDYLWAFDNPIDQPDRRMQAALGPPPAPLVRASNAEPSFI
jgi:hypothetical protein